jgi:hypothetical protein
MFGFSLSLYFIDHNRQGSHEHVAVTFSNLHKHSIDRGSEASINRPSFITLARTAHIIPLIKYSFRHFIISNLLECLIVPSRITIYFRIVVRLYSTIKHEKIKFLACFLGEVLPPRIQRKVVALFNLLSDS